MRSRLKTFSVGEVWVCSGQSNMGMTVSKSTDAAKIAEEAKTDAFKGIRLFKVPIAGADERQNSVKNDVGAAKRTNGG